MFKLEDDYPGDEDWLGFTQYYFDNYLDDNTKIIALELHGNLDIAVLIYGKRGLTEGMWWIDQRVPALENKRPVDCLDNPELIKRLKVCVMRMC